MSTVELRRFRWLALVQESLDRYRNKILLDYFVAANSESPALAFATEELKRIVQAELTILESMGDYDFDHSPTTEEIHHYVSLTLGISKE